MLLSLLVAVAACAPAPPPAPVFPAATPAVFLTRALGAPPEIVVVGHLSDLLRDPVYGPGAQRAFSRGLGSRTAESDGPSLRGLLALSAIDRAELYVVTRSAEEPTRMVVVLRGVPASVTPLTFVREDGTPAYRHTQTFPSGISEYAPSPNAHGWVFALPDHTWIVADDATAPRVASLLTTDPSAPPPPGFAPDALVAVYFAPSIFGKARSAGWLTQHMPSEGAVLAIHSGRSGEVSLLVKFASPALAAQAVAETETRFKDLLPPVPHEIVRTGDIVTLRFKLTMEMSDKLLGAAAAMPPRAPAAEPALPPASAPSLSSVPVPAPPRLAPLPPSLTCDSTVARITPAARLRDPAPPPVAGQMTEQAANAKRLFDAEKWEDAIAALSRVARGETRDDDGNRQLAEYHRAVALFRAKREVESAAAFRTIAKSPQHLKHRETLLWLTKLAAEHPELLSLTDFERYGREDVRKFDNANQQTTYGAAAYLVGRHRLGVGALAEARELLGLVPPDHPYAAQAQRCRDVAR